LCLLAHSFTRTCMLIIITYPPTHMYPMKYHGDYFRQSSHFPYMTLHEVWGEPVSTQWLVRGWSGSLADSVLGLGRRVLGSIPLFKQELCLSRHPRWFKIAIGGTPIKLPSLWLHGCQQKVSKWCTLRNTESKHPIGQFWHTPDTDQRPLTPDTDQRPLTPGPWHWSGYEGRRLVHTRVSAS